MAICFFCTCGHNLCVDENWAGGSTRCLGCGCLVRVPIIARASQIQVVPPVPVLEIKVTEVPMLPRAPLPYRQPKTDNDDEVYQLVEEAEVPDGPDMQRRLERRQLRRVLAEAQRDLARRRRLARPWPLETHWFEFLLYPLRAWRLVCGLALAWATLMAILVAILPTDWTFWETIARLPLLLFVFLLAGFTCSCLDAILAAAAEGQAGYIAKPNGDQMLRAAGSGAQVVACFLAGPIVPALVALWFWLASGDFELADWLIVWELGLLAVGYWILALLSVQQSRRFRDANPAAIVKLVKRLGYRGVLAPVVVSIVVVMYGLLMFDALEELHRSLSGWLLMLWYWGGLLFLTVLMLRWLGVGMYRARERQTGLQD